MIHLVMSVDKFEYKDKKTNEVKEARVVYLMRKDGKSVKPIFMNKDYYDKFSFDNYVLNKDDVTSLFANHKTCDIDFDSDGKIVSVEDSE